MDTIDQRIEAAKTKLKQLHAQKQQLEARQRVWMQISRYVVPVA